MKRQLTEMLFMTRRLFIMLAFAAEIFASPLALAAEWPVTILGQEEFWDAATDIDKQSRFIPMQLIVPGIWDGTSRIDLPVAQGHDAEGTVWSGPQEWRNPYTDQTLTVYDRRRTNRREGLVEQKMTVRGDGSAIGRAYDSRFGGLVCDQEAKFPLGLWKQGEVRSYDYTCLTTRDGHVETKRRSSRITIEALDYEYGGIAHSLRFSWRHTDSDSETILDHRTYIFSPGRGLVGHARK